MTFLGSTFLVASLISPIVPPPLPADHGDTPLLASLGRPDARITDLHVFTRGDKLVITLCSNPAVPPGLTSYLWSADVTFKVHIDTSNDARVTFNDPLDLAEYGGTIEQPDRLRERIVLAVRGDAAGDAQLTVRGIGDPYAQTDVQFFAGVRDDPFIRGPRIGRNVAALVFEVPLRRIVRGPAPLLVWATASIDGRPEPFQELAGRALRSMFGANDYMNTSTPREHAMVFNGVPDVVIYDITRPASYPNGRELVDDVVDLVGEPSILANDAPFPSTNDVPFLTTFPYLAPPQ